MITENIVIGKNFSWIDIEKPERPDFDFLEHEFNLPALLVQDCLRPEHLPKFEKTQSGYFFLARIYDPYCQNKSITIEDLTNKLAIFISNNRMVTIHNDSLPYLRKFTDLRDSEDFPTDPRKLVHHLFRISTMTFEDSIARLQKLYEEFEHEVLSKASDSLSYTRVYQFRRQLHVLRGIMQLTQSAISNSRDFWCDHLSLQQDIKENIDQIYFRIDDLSHNFDQLFSLHLSISEQSSNHVMKVLTVFASIMLPLTFIASFYGMNFDHMPGLHTTTGFVGALLIMATTSFVTVWFFNRKKWFKHSM